MSATHLSTCSQWRCLLTALTLLLRRSRWGYSYEWGRMFATHLTTSFQWRHLPCCCDCSAPAGGRHHDAWTSASEVVCVQFAHPTRAAYSPWCFVTFCPAGLKEVVMGLGGRRSVFNQVRRTLRRTLSPTANTQRNVIVLKLSVLSSSSGDNRIDAIVASAGSSNSHQDATFGHIVSRACFFYYVVSTVEVTWRLLTFPFSCNCNVVRVCF